MEANVGKALAAVVDALGAASLDYAVVGGLAVSAWVGARATRDADLWVKLEGAEATLQLKLEEAAFHVPAMREELERFGVFRAKHKPTGVFVDIFNAVGPLGEAILEHRNRAVIGGRPVWLASANDVAVLKAYSDRPRDFDDLTKLLALSEVDLEYIRIWAKQLDDSIGSDEVTLRIDRALASKR